MRGDRVKILRRLGRWVVLCLGWALAVTGAQAAEAPEAAAPTGRHFICSSFGSGKVVEYDAEGRLVRSFTASRCNDVWSLADGSVLMTTGIGVAKYDGEGQLVFRREASGAPEEVHACQPLPGGGAVYVSNTRQRVIELDAAGEVKREVPMPIQVPEGERPGPHLRYRMARRLPSGNFLVMAHGFGAVWEFDDQGGMVRELRGFRGEGAHAVVRLPNGNTLVSTGKGRSVLELDPEGRTVWSVTDEDLPEVTMTFVTGICRLSNGNTMIALYKGSHHLVEVNPEKQVVWTAVIPGLRDVTSVQVIEPGQTAEALPLK